MKHDTPDQAAGQTTRDQAMMEVVYKIVHDLRGSVRALAELPNCRTGLGRIWRTQA
ncbi:MULTISPECIES: hypothetical protein [unclassified Phaeobacter]|uniref:hypothetical protein n=1 Tax=unclassified Phaeobacter TaxID=2621772 RepID=UPI003A85A267